VAIGTVIGEGNEPIEIAPGRGDLRFSSAGLSFIERYVSLVNRQVSYSNLYASQPLLGGVVGWLLKQSVRVPLKAYSGASVDDRVRLRPDQHPLARAIVQPWEGGNQSQLVQQLLGGVLIQGNSTHELLVGRGSLTFEWADWRHVNPVMPWRDTISGWELDVDIPERKRAVSEDDVLHVANWNPLGPLGLSPLSQLGVTIAIEDAAQRTQKMMLTNGVHSATAVETTDERFFGLDPSERQELIANFKSDVRELDAGPESAGTPWVLPPGLTVKNIGQTAVEASLIDQRHVNRSEALGLYNIMPGAYGGGVAERMTEIEVQWTQSITGGLAPPLIIIEQAINAQVARARLGEDNVFVEFDFAGILRGDKLKEVEALREAIGSALMTPNQGKSVLNLPQSGQPGMDDHYLPRNNLWPLSVPYPATGMSGEDNGAVEPNTPEEKAGFRESESGLLVPA